MRQFDPFSSSYYSPVIDNVLWAPGQYAKIEYWQQKSTSEKTSIGSELNNFAWLNGILWQVRWSEHELTRGVFNKTLLDEYYNICASRGKYCVFLMPVRQFQSIPENFVENWILPPDLMTQTGLYADGVTRKFANLWAYTGGAGGYNMNLFNSVIVNRYTEFLQYVASHFDGLQYFAGVMFTESATGSPRDGYSGGNGEIAHYNGLLNLYKAANAAFTKSIVFCDINFSTDFASSMIGAGATDGLFANGLAFTTSNSHNGSNNASVLSQGLALIGKVPVGFQLQALEFQRTNGNIPADPINNPEPSMDYLFNRIHTLYPNDYLFVQRTTPSAAPFYWDQWTAFMEASEFANDPTSGVRVTKPIRIK